MRLIVLLFGMRIDRDRIRHRPVFEERRQPQFRLNRAINSQCENDGNTVDGGKKLLVPVSVPVLESSVLSGPEKIRSRDPWSHIVS